MEASAKLRDAIHTFSSVVEENAAVPGLAEAWAACRDMVHAFQSSTLTHLAEVEALLGGQNDKRSGQERASGAPAAGLLAHRGHGDEWGKAQFAVAHSFLLQIFRKAKDSKPLVSLYLGGFGFGRVPDELAGADAGLLFFITHPTIQTPKHGRTVTIGSSFSEGAVAAGEGEGGGASGAGGSGAAPDMAALARAASAAVAGGGDDGGRGEKTIAALTQARVAQNWTLYKVVASSKKADEGALHDECAAWLGALETFASIGAVDVPASLAAELAEQMAAAGADAETDACAAGGDGNSEKAGSEKKKADKRSAAERADDSYAAGWLQKKQAKGNAWNKRFFVLIDSQLMYFRKERDVKASETIDVSGRTVGVVPADLSPSLAIFYVSSPGERSYILEAASAEEATEWLSALVDSAGAVEGELLPEDRAFFEGVVAKKEKKTKGKKGKKKKGKEKKPEAVDTSVPVFGVPLESLLDHPLTLESRVPYLLLSSVKYIVDENACALEGIFRLSGAASDVQILRDLYNQPEPFDLKALGIDTYTSAAIVKYFLRELPEALMTHDRYAALVAAGEAEDVELGPLIAVVKDLPELNRDVLAFLLGFLAYAATFSASSKMSPANLAIVVGPNLIRYPDLSPLEEVSASTAVNKVVTALIENADAVLAAVDRVGFWKDALAEVDALAAAVAAATGADDAAQPEPEPEPKPETPDAPAAAKEPQPDPPLAADAGTVPTDDAPPPAPLPDAGAPPLPLPPPDKPPLPIPPKPALPPPVPGKPPLPIPPKPALPPPVPGKPPLPIPPKPGAKPPLAPKPLPPAAAAAVAAAAARSAAAAAAAATTTTTDAATSDAASGTGADSGSGSSSGSYYSYYSSSSDSNDDGSGSG